MPEKTVEFKPVFPPVLPFIGIIAAAGLCTFMFTNPVHPITTLILSTLHLPHEFLVASFYVLVTFHAGEARIAYDICKRGGMRGWETAKWVMGVALAGVHFLGPLLKAHYLYKKQAGDKAYPTVSSNMMRLVCEIIYIPNAFSATLSQCLPSGMLAYIPTVWQSVWHSSPLIWFLIVSVYVSNVALTFWYCWELEMETRSMTAWVAMAAMGGGFISVDALASARNIEAAKGEMTRVGDKSE